MNELDRLSPLGLLQRWERLYPDLKPQTRDALLAFNELYNDTSIIIGVFKKAPKDTKVKTVSEVVDEMREIAEDLFLNNKTTFEEDQIFDVLFDAIETRSKGQKNDNSK